MTECVADFRPRLMAGIDIYKPSDECDVATNTRRGGAE